ncbi:MAG: prolyl oligopeptidase family serine peptidase [Microscillaceae bacterium]|nr:prolyl oligopeptidase family serine peptidase [Microscillaceae bacterium]MDW8461432.1 prolyl oligopeptidase family serine peptidase [Cytophagales bacterium]
MLKHCIFCGLFLLLNFFAFAQTSKKPLTHQAYQEWKTLPLGERKLSQNGKWVTYQLKTLESDNQVALHATEGNLSAQIFERGENAVFSADSRFFLFKIKPHNDTLKNQRRRKVATDKLPKDSLAILDLQTNALLKIPRVKSFRVPEKGLSFVAYQLEIDEPAKPSIKPKTDSLKKKQDSTQVVKIEPQTLDEAKKIIQELEKKLAKTAEPTKRLAKKAPKKETKESGSKLILRNLLTAKQDTFVFVTEFVFNKNGTQLAFASTGNDSTFKAGVYVVDLQTQKVKHILNSAGKFKNLVFDEVGSQLAFVADLDTTQKHEKELIKHFSLYYWNDKQPSAQLFAHRNTAGIPINYMINEHVSPFFAKNGEKLFFATNPILPVADTTLLPEEIVNVDIWHWKDGKIQTQQNVELTNERKRGYWAVALLKQQNKILQLASPEIPNILVPNEGNANFVIAVTNKPYEILTTWQGYSFTDVYYISFQDGKPKKILEKLQANPQTSPQGNYLFWYSEPDSAWFSYHIAQAKTFNLTKNLPVAFYDELNDVPDFPNSYGSAGWIENDALLLVYDRYDIWALHPENKQPAKNLTQIGRKNQISFRNIRLDNEERFFKPNQLLYLRAFHEISKESGFYSLNLGKNENPQKLILQPYRFEGLMKAKNAEKFIFTRENFQEFGDIYLTDATFTNIQKLSHANPQQSQYLWGEVELVTWFAPSGEQLQGLLYKPENFDKSQKYPMITYFYERLSDNLHQYIVPAPSPSTIRTCMFTSNGYLVFMPDIPYRKAEPGKSAYDAVISGVLSVIEKGFVDTKRMAIHGQSWGGYQTVYLITQTNLFACAMAGAPVVNMTSAYGGIRYGTGVSRIFQYERGQSRIGATLWERPFAYLENSPLFNLHKVQTPLLIMHNDRDGAVPFTQGIELYMGLRRLQKPVWMLTYNGEDHNLIENKNRKDLSIRMQQFFDHYLKNAPMPYWMRNGVTAIEKGINLRYELEK